MKTLPEEITRHFGTNLAKPTFLGHAFRIVDDSEPDCRRWTLELLIPGKGWQSWSWMALDESTLFLETYAAYEQGKITPALTDDEAKLLNYHGFTHEFSEGEVYATCKTGRHSAQLFKSVTGWKWLRGVEKVDAGSLEDAVGAITLFQEENPTAEDRLIAALEELSEDNEGRIEHLLNDSEHAA